MSSVYLETSFFSECCTIRSGEIARGRRATDNHRRPRAVAITRSGYAGLNATGVNPMSADSESKLDTSEETGVTDVRLVREKIAAQYNGDLRKHVSETDESAN
jgi:hypothetical protein